MQSDSGSSGRAPCVEDFRQGSALSTSAPGAGGELTFEEFCLLPMQYWAVISADSYDLQMYRNDQVGIQREVYTPRNPRTQAWGKGKSSLFMDNDGREFANVTELYIAWMHRICGVPEAQPMNTDSASGSPVPTGRGQMNKTSPPPFRRSNDHRAI